MNTQGADRLADARDELGPDDLRDVAEHGLTADEVARQLALLRSPPPPARLLRPCTPGDGVEVLSDAGVDRCLEAHARAAASGRFTCFVPASGAASRMFKALQSARSGAAEVRRGDLAARASAGDADARQVLELVDGIERLAVFPEVDRSLRDRAIDLATVRAGGSLAPLFEALLDPSGLDLGERAKGLLPFHRNPDEFRTAFEEHLVDAALYARSGDGAVRLHFTVSEAHRDAFAALLESVRAKYEARFGVRYDVSFSTQRPETDTIATDGEGRPFRDADGHLLFRPGGHGALLANLGDLGADLVFIKNIDNVVPDHLKPPVVRWKKVLGGRLARLVERVHGVLDRLAADRDRAVAEGFELLASDLGIRAPAAVENGSIDDRAKWLAARLDRPIRVCGVVRCEGDPGGAPFWVPDGEGGASPQIVETAEVDARDPSQLAIHRSASHFNPVDVACSLRDHRGRPFDLARFVDRERVFIAEKSSGGRSLRALEHPGLWNGAMARWTTLFVEVPAATFHPVKTINDLLAPDHQPERTTP
jgi:hypothetical protein